LTINVSISGSQNGTGRKISKDSLRRPFQILILAFVYVVTARIGLSLDPVGGLATPFWPPTGIALAALLIFGQGLWPGVALGAFIANAISGASAPLALGIATGNTLEAVVGAYVLTRVDFRNDLSRVRDVLALAIFAALGSTLLSSVIGTGAMRIAGRLDNGSWAYGWFTWWIGDALGNLVIAPLILVWSHRLRATIGRGELLEGFALTVAFAFVASGIFGIIDYGRLSEYLKTHYYTLFPITVWAAASFRQRGAVTIVFAASAFSLWGAVHGFMPHDANAPLSNRLLSLQLFIATLALTGLVLGAAVCESKWAIQAREEFLAIASHELRNPLTSLKLQLQML
jgi:integral membrane sensor domain MASE1